MKQTAIRQEIKSLRKGLLVLMLIGIVLFAFPSSGEESPVLSPYATGGMVQRVDLGGCRVSYIHTFTNTDEVLSFASTGKRVLKVRYLVVGAGGSGGGSRYLSTQNSGAGGGGGGVCEKAGVEFGAGSVWSVLVGKGASSVDATAGASSISNGVADIETVPGGGNAGIRTSNDECVDATSGAAGGGAPGVKDNYPGAEGTYVSSILGELYGPFGGGKATKRQGGGGGGAAEKGGNAATVGNDSVMSGPAKGGEGLVSDISGEALVYGSGGGAGECRFVSGSTVYRYQGGDGGTRAGDGSKYVVTVEDGVTKVSYKLATAPVPNSGAGGGGAGYNNGASGALSRSTGGADGVVIIRYDVTEAPCEGGDIVTKTLKRGTKYTYVHTFTNSAAASSFVNCSGENLKVRYLVVGAGGAGGGSRYGGTQNSGAGGGGGGVCEKAGVEFGAGSVWSVLVGKGASSVDATAGASSISNGVADIETVPGGGNAGIRTSNDECVDATSGAAGGGAPGVKDNYPGAEGTFASSILGELHGPFGGGTATKRQGGGGGGAAEKGGNAATVGNDSVMSGPAKGGEGLVSDISGEALVYGSGGGAGECRFGSTTVYRYQGGDGGTRAGDGSKYVVTVEDGVTKVSYKLATAPVPNSGAGGGGAGYNNGASGALSRSTGGADGIVIIRYDYDANPPGLVIIVR